MVFIQYVVINRHCEKDINNFYKKCKRYLLDWGCSITTSEKWSVIKISFDYCGLQNGLHTSILYWDDVNESICILWKDEQRKGQDLSPTQYTRTWVHRIVKYIGTRSANDIFPTTSTIQNYLQATIRLYGSQTCSRLMINYMSLSEWSITNMIIYLLCGNK